MILDDGDTVVEGVAIDAAAQKDAASRIAVPQRVSGALFDAETFGQAYFTEGSNYGGRYDSYNPPHKIAGYLSEIRRLQPRGSLLDVGCAFGRFLQAARNDYVCEGVDISEYALRLAQERLADIPLHCSPIQSFQPGRTYDVVTCFDVLEHVPALDYVLRHLRMLLAPRGILAFAVPVYDSPPGWLFGLIDRDHTHVHRHGRRFWLEQLIQAGFEPIVFKGILRAPLPGYFVHKISPLLRWFSSAIFVICRVRETSPGSQR